MVTSPLGRLKSDKYVIFLVLEKNWLKPKFSGYRVAVSRKPVTQKESEKHSDAHKPPPLSLATTLILLRWQSGKKVCGTNPFDGDHSYFTRAGDSEDETQIYESYEHQQTDMYSYEFYPYLAPHRLKSSLMSVVSHWHCKWVNQARLQVDEVDIYYSK